MFSNKSYIVSTGVYVATDVQKNNDVLFWSHTWKRFGKSSFLGVTPSSSHKFLGVLTTSVGGVGDDVLRGLLGWRASMCRMIGVGSVFAWVEC